MFLAALAALAAAGIAGYQYKKNKDKKTSSSSTTSATATTTDDDKKNIAQNVYNYNYLNDSNTGNTLFSSQQKTKRAIFGADLR